MPRRLLAVIPTLRGGGAERAMSGICSAAAAAGHDVTLLTFFPPEPDDYPLDPRCARQSLGLGFSSLSPARAALNNWRRVRGLRGRIDALRPDTILSFIDNANVVTILAAAGLGARVVVTEQVDPRMHRIPKPWPQLRRLTYPFANLVVVLTDGMAKGWAVPRFGADRVRVIPNPVALRIEQDGPREPGDYLLAVGRLDPQKGFDTLIRAYAAASAQGLRAPLVILGEGPDRDALLALASQLGVGERVRLPGRTTEIPRWYRGARAFVLSSRYEGMPLALLEALAFGIPCVATDCPTGPADLLGAGAGMLVPVDDVARLASGLLRVTQDDDLRRSFAARGRDVAAHHSLDVVMRLWTTALELDR